MFWSYIFSMVTWILGFVFNADIGTGSNSIFESLPSHYDNSYNFLKMSLFSVNIKSKSNRK